MRVQFPLFSEKSRPTVSLCYLFLSRFLTRLYRSHLIFSDINRAICRRVLRFLSMTFLPYTVGKPFEEQPLSTGLSELSRRYTTGSHGGSVPNCPPQFLPPSSLSCPFPRGHQTPLSSFFCTRSDARMAIYIMVALVFSRVRMPRWQMDRKETRRGEARLMKRKNGRSLPRLDESLRFESRCERAKGGSSSSRSLVKSATYPMILSSVEVIHDRENERRTKRGYPVKRSFCSFVFADSRARAMLLASRHATRMLTKRFSEKSTS